MKKKTLLTHFNDCLTNDGIGILRIIDGNGMPHEYSWEDLMGHAASAAAWMASQGVQEGDVVPILRKFGFEQIRDFVGAILLGAIPCVLAFPNPKMSESIFLKKLLGVIGPQNLRYCIVDDALKPFFDEKVKREYQSIKALSCGGLQRSSAFPFLLKRKPKPEDVAFLQHSSGTSGVPKGVAITHEILLNHLEGYGKKLQITSEDKIVSWLPLYHDMGMVACLLGSLIWNVPSSHMGNFFWVLDPSRLLREIEVFKGTIVWLPNFAFSLMSRTPYRAESDCDLSSVKKWISCSEPILEKSFVDFHKRFESYGVKKTSLRTCYAMAENVFAVTQSSQNPKVLYANRTELEQKRRYVADIGGSHVRSLVSSGEIIEGVKLAIKIDDETLTSYDDKLGEILIKGPSILREYYANKKATENAFRDGWYHSGDVGFLHEGELYVVGRNKDTIIIGGRNVDPTEMEAIANDMEGVITGRVCCLGIDNENLGTQEAHLMLETALPPEGHQQLIARVKQQIKAETDFQLKQVWCVSAKWLVKSSSGKIARPENKDKLLAQKLHKSVRQQVIDAV